MKNSIAFLLFSVFLFAIGSGIGLGGTKYHSYSTCVEGIGNGVPSLLAGFGGGGATDVVEGVGLGGTSLLEDLEPIETKV